MINYDQGNGVQVDVSGVSNKSMKSVLTMTNIAMTQVSLSLQTSPSVLFSALRGLKTTVSDSALCACETLGLENSNFAIFQAGTYTCSPSMARPDSVNVTVKHHEQAMPEPVVNSEASVIFPELLLFTILTLIMNVF